MDSLFDKEIRILDNHEFWSDYKKENMAREPFHKQDVLKGRQQNLPESFLIFDVNIFVPGKCMNYYMQGVQASVMAQKWISYCEGDSLFWCRSWTGNITYRAQFVKEGPDYRIIKLFVNNDPNQVDTSFYNEGNKRDIILDLFTLMSVGKSSYPPVKDLIVESARYKVSLGDSNPYLVSVSAVTY